ncbi:hypothetical protein GPJ56_008921 [Histomonas meleagridis]|uniref:uncharacterized protein n=1 Tax=Histomonas meleagridis TaxID=135588 RepID=UPI0035596036|nr:hypothetical protein GPJ56_008921 [Histomonas meleagridis]KAH0797847.1 hypothetical protein GO595_009476 [Histomonas meleagridis]
MMQTMDQADLPDPDITGSHEEFWTFTQVSQWGSHWPYSNNEHLNQVRNVVITVRNLGINNGIKPRMVHIAQMLIWRFYLSESIAEYPSKDIIPLAFESAAQLLETSFQFKVNQMPHSMDNNKQLSEFQLHFKLVNALNFNIRIHHPSDYLSHYVNSKFTNEQFQLAECIISDSFLCPCCLVHRPTTIAEGSAIMAAGMKNNTDSVIPRSTKAISFIKDMNWFYNQSFNQKK